MDYRRLSEELVSVNKSLAILEKQPDSIKRRELISSINLWLNPLQPLSGSERLNINRIQDEHITRLRTKYVLFLENKLFLLFPDSISKDKLILQFNESQAK
jgi:hypothetical protein